MAGNSLCRHGFQAAAFLFFLSAAFLPPAGAQVSFLQEGADGGQELVQEIRWEALEDILDYEFILEKDAGGFTEVLRRRQEDSSVRLSLGAGRYRYRITVYNLLGQAESSTDWIYFTVEQAHQPVLESLSPQPLLLDASDGTLELRGENLFADSDYVLSRRRRPVQSVAVQEVQDGGVRLLIDRAALDAGRYELTVTNPGGLSAGLPVSLAFSRTGAFAVSAGYGCAAVLYDGVIPEYFGSRVFPLGAVVRAEYMAVRRRRYSAGFGAFASYTFMRAQNGRYTLSGSVLCGFADAVLRVPFAAFRKDLVLDVRGGFGAADFRGYRFSFAGGSRSGTLDSLNLGVHAGLAVQCALRRGLYAEAGLDFADAFVSDMSYGMLLPSVSLGWRFPE